MTESVPAPGNLTVLRDALARAIRIAEFVDDGEIREAALALDNLVADLWKFLATLERPRGEAA